MSLVRFTGQIIYCIKSGCTNKIIYYDSGGDIRLEAKEQGCYYKDCGKNIGEVDICSRHNTEKEREFWDNIGIKNDI